MTDERPRNGDDGRSPESREWRVRYAGFQGDQTAIRARSEECTSLVRTVRRLAVEDSIGLDGEQLTSHDTLLAAVDALEEAEISESSVVEQLVDAIIRRRRITREQVPDVEAIVDQLATGAVRDSVVILTANDPQLERLTERLPDRIKSRLPHRVYQVKRGASGGGEDPIQSFTNDEGSAILLSSLPSLPASGSLPCSSFLFVGSTEAVPTPAGLSDMIGPSELARCPVAFIVGLPHTIEGRIPPEDGQALLETAAQLRTAAHRLGLSIRFSAESRAVTNAIAQLETEGRTLIRELDAAGLDDRDASPAEARCLGELLEDPSTSGSSAGLLRRWDPPPPMGAKGEGMGARAGATQSPVHGGPDAGVHSNECVADEGDTSVRNRIRGWLSSAGESTASTSDRPRPSESGPGPSAGGADSGTPPRHTGLTSRTETGTGGFDSGYRTVADEEERVQLLSQDPYRTRVGTAKRFWRSYVDEPFDTDPVKLVRALGRDLPGSLAANLDDDLWREVLIIELRQLTEALGMPPSPRDMQRYGAFPPYEYMRRFETWTAALERAGIDIDEIETSAGGDTEPPDPIADLPVGSESIRQGLIEELEDLAAVLGAPPAPIDMQKFGTYSPQAYADTFGTWAEALAAAGIEYEPDSGSARTDDDGKSAGIDPLVTSSPTEVEGALVAELRQLAVVIGGPPTRQDVKKFGEYPPQRYIHTFGSWSAAIRRAGIGSAGTTSTDTGNGGIAEGVIGPIRGKLLNR